MMNKRNIVNLVLIVLIAIMAAIAVLDNSDKEEKQSITSLAQTDVNNIRIKRLGKGDIVIKKQYNKWRLIKPYNTATNQFRIDTLLRLVETIPKSTYPLANIENYGLVEPKLEVHFNQGEANHVSIKFGDSEPIKMRRYISVGDKLHITNDTYFYALNSVATDYINNKLLPDNFKITRLNLPNLKIEFKDESWHVSPKPKDFSVDGVNELMSEWQNLISIEIKPFNLKTKTAPLQTIKIVGKDASTYNYAILKNDDEFILIDRLKGLQYSFPNEKRNVLLKFPTLKTDEQDVTNKSP